METLCFKTKTAVLALSQESIKRVLSKFLYQRFKYKILVNKIFKPFIKDVFYLLSKTYNYL